MGVYEELDQKVYEKNFQSLEENMSKLTRGCVKLCQVVGVFPGARMNDGTEEELDVDVELLNWEDCAQNLTGRVKDVETVVFTEVQVHLGPCEQKGGSFSIEVAPNFSTAH